MSIEVDLRESISLESYDVADAISMEGSEELAEILCCIIDKKDVRRSRSCVMDGYDVGMYLGSKDFSGKRLQFVIEMLAGLAQVDDVENFTLRVKDLINDFDADPDDVAGEAEEKTGE